MRRKSKSLQRKLEDKIWELCKNITRARYGNTCFTCGQSGLVAGNWQTGHLWAKASLGASLKYDLRVLRPQCYRCNIHFGGLGAVFLRNLEAKEGKKFITKLEKDKIQDKRGLLKASDYYPTLLERYQIIWEDLQNQSTDGI